MAEIKPEKSLYDMTITELRELLEELYHEIDNHGGALGQLFANAHGVLVELIAEYLDPRRS